jgi:outer membrane biogenesis lipoprotein LolB
MYPKKAKDRGMQKHSFRFIVLLTSAMLMAGCSSYDHKQATDDFFEAANNNSEANGKNTTQHQQDIEHSVIADGIVGGLYVGFQWLSSLGQPATKN